MDHDNKLLCRGCSYLITAIISILLIVTYTVYIIIRASGGVIFTKGDIICAAILISFGTVILVIMLICLCLETQYCRQKETVGTLASRRFKRISETDGDCSICLDAKNSTKKTVVVLSCEHTFHKKCVNKWLSQKFPPSCPECRQPSKKFSHMTKIGDLLNSLTLKYKPEKKDPVSFV